MFSFRVARVYVSLELLVVFIKIALISVECVRTSVTDADIFPTLFAVYVNTPDSVATVLFAPRPRFGLSANQTLPSSPCATPHQPTEQCRKLESEQQTHVDVFLK